MAPPTKPLRHGTAYAYQRGCKCDPCKAAHRKRIREYRKAKKRKGR